MKILFLALSAHFCFGAAPLLASAVKYDLKSSEIEYTVSHPLKHLTNFLGEVRGYLTVDPSDWQKNPEGEIHIAAGSFHADLLGYDENVNRALKFGANSEVFFRVETIEKMGGAELPVARKSPRGRWQFGGKLKMAGVTRAKTIPADCEILGTNISCQFDFKISLAEFRVEIPSIVGLPLNDSVRVWGALQWSKEGGAP